MKKIICLLTALVMLCNISYVSASTVGEIEITKWLDSITYLQTENCSGYTILSGAIGDSKVTLNTENQKFYENTSHGKEELKGDYSYVIDGKKLKAGENSVTIYFDDKYREYQFVYIAKLNLTKDNQDAPSLSISSKGKTWIKVKAVSGCQYKVSGGKWQSSNKFTGLKKGKTYKVYIRKKETATLNASKPVSLKVKTIKTKK